MHVMPRVLYKDPDTRTHGGLEHESQVVYQQHNGILEWAGRYSLVQPDFSEKMARMFYEKDNQADTDRKFRKESKHKFFIQQTSMFRLHLSTI